MKVRHLIIPAAGLATRFLPASKTIPKELFPVLNKPVIQYVIEEAVDSGISEAIFITASGKGAVLDHFDKINKKFNIEKLDDLTKKEINSLEKMVDVVSIRQKEPKGLGHAVLMGTNLIPDTPFSVMLPDVLLYPFKGNTVMKKMRELFEKHKCSIIALAPVDENEKHKYGIAEGDLDGEVLEIKNLIEKPKKDETPSNLAIVGRYIFTPSIKKILQETKPGKNNEIQLTDAMKELLKTEKMLGVVIDKATKLFDTGKPDGLALANAFFATKENPVFFEKLKSFLEN